MGGEADASCCIILEKYSDIPYEDINSDAVAEMFLVGRLLA